MITALVMEVNHFDHVVTDIYPGMVGFQIGDTVVIFINIFLVLIITFL
jgi:hypothetical protein